MGKLAICLAARLQLAHRPLGADPFSGVRVLVLDAPWVILGLLAGYLKYSSASLPAPTLWGLGRNMALYSEPCAQRRTLLWRATGREDSGSINRPIDLSGQRHLPF